MSAVGFVYFIATEDRTKVKIGWSKSPQKRFRSIQAAAFVKLELLGSVPGTVYAERALHAQFVGHHARGEWFDGAPEIFEAAAGIIAAGKIPAHLLGSADLGNPLSNRHRGVKRTPDQCKRISDGIRQANARGRARYDEACRLAVERQLPNTAGCA